MDLTALRELIGSTDNDDRVTKIKIGIVKEVKDNGQYLVTTEGRMYLATSVNSLELDVKNVVYISKETTTSKWFILGVVT
ncbi:hypothetical protein CCP3SC1AL1_3380003 [Gammaproteobacteria bacterium]